MKVVYIAVVFNVDTDLGVIKKINSQIESLIALGIDSRGYIFFERRSDTEKNPIEKEHIKFIEVSNNKIRHSFVYKINRRKHIIDKIEEVLQGIEFDFIYFRYMICDWNLLNLVKKYPRKVIFEHQAKESAEYRLGRRWGAIILDSYFFRIITKYLAGSVAVTEEIALYEKNRQRNKQYFITTISNGIEVEKTSSRDIPPLSNENLILLFVGNIASWQGLDRLIKGIYQYNGKTKVLLYIVGEGPERVILDALVKSLHLQDLIFFTGKLTGRELENFFNTCHIAIGSLGIHRKDLEEASTLKVREYMSRGIPFIISYRDIDINNNLEFSPYYYKVTADNSAINIRDVVDFANGVYKIKDYHLKMRELALKYIDIKLKSAKLIKFMENLSCTYKAKGR